MANAINNNNNNNNNNNGLSNIQDYARLRQVGHGASGVVYEARKGNNTQTCALKIVPFTSINEFNALLREPLLLRSLVHPNVVAYANTFIHQEANMLTQLCSEMPFFQEGDFGQPLDSCFTNNRVITPADAASYMQQILNGVHFLHSNNIIHRDLKPENLLMSNNGRHITIADFGIARLVSGACTTYVGTRPYMSPEVAETVFGTGIYDTSADMWSVGVIGCDMILCRPRDVRHHMDNTSYLLLIRLGDETRFQVYIKDLLMNVVGGFSEQMIDFCISLLRLNGSDRPTAAVAFQQLKAISNSNQQLSLVDASLTSVTMELRQLRDEMTQLMAITSNSAAVINQLTTAASNSATTMAELRQQNDVQHNQMAALTTNFDALRQLNIDLQTQLTTAASNSATTMAELRQQNDVQHNQMAALTTNFDAVLQQNFAVQNQMAALTTNFAELRQPIVDLQTQVRQQNVAHQNQAAAVIPNTAQISAVAPNTPELRQPIVDLQTQLRQPIVDLQTQISAVTPNTAQLPLASASAAPLTRQQREQQTVQSAMKFFSRRRK